MNASLRVISGNRGRTPRKDYVLTIGSGYACLNSHAGEPRAQPPPEHRSHAAGSVRTATIGAGRPAACARPRRGDPRARRRPRARPPGKTRSRGRAARCSSSTVLIKACRAGRPARLPRPAAPAAGTSPRQGLSSEGPAQRVVTVGRSGGSRLGRRGCSPHGIARRVGRCVPSVPREIARNRDGP